MYYTRFFKIKLFRENKCQPLLYNMPVPHRPQAYTSSLVCLIVYSILLNIVNNDTTSRHLTCQITLGICYRSPCKMIKSSIFHSISPQYYENIRVVLEYQIPSSDTLKIFRCLRIHLCLRVSN